MQTITINGNSPATETAQQVAHAGWPAGTPILAQGRGRHPHQWQYIVTRSGLRKPTEVESFLFRVK